MFSDQWIQRFNIFWCFKSLKPMRKIEHHYIWCFKTEQGNVRLMFFRYSTENLKNSWFCHRKLFCETIILYDIIRNLSSHEQTCLVRLCFERCFSIDQGNIRPDDRRGISQNETLLNTCSWCYKLIIILGTLNRHAWNI